MPLFSFKNASTTVLYKVPTDGQQQDSIPPGYGSLGIWEMCDHEMNIQRNNKYDKTVSAKVAVNSFDQQ